MISSLIPTKALKCFSILQAECHDTTYFSPFVDKVEQTESCIIVISKNEESLSTRLT